MKDKCKRPAIPKETILKLWASAAGRCEFAGCNKPLWRDGLTWEDANLSHIVHIVAFSPDGPRGDKILSKKLSADYSNLMLACFNHHKLIDSEKYVNKYTVECLKKYKKAHEDRIKVQTAAKEEMKTTILIFKAKVGDRMVDIPYGHVVDAIAPKYPSGDKGIVLDYTNFSARDSKSYWQAFKDQIRRDIELQLSKESGVKNLSIFAIGPIPLLIYLGERIGNIIPSDLYQRHRDTQRWAWKRKKSVKGFKYVVRRANIKAKSKDVTLVLSLSGKIQNRDIIKCIDPVGPRYELTIDKPSPLFLDSKDKSVQFQGVFRKLMTEIRQRHGAKCKIRLFPAVPAPIAVMCGKELLPKVDPSLFVYDYVDNRKGFKFAFRIN